MPVDLRSKKNMDPDVISMHSGSFSKLGGYGPTDQAVAQELYHMQMA